LSVNEINPVKSHNSLISPQTDSHHTSKHPW